MHGPFLALSVDSGNQAHVLVLGFQALHGLPSSQSPRELLLFNLKSSLSLNPW